MKVSVIVPIYKAEKYLNQCIQSLITQDYSDYEIILINDGSPDHCGEICEQYAAANKQIRVIHQKNTGVSAARNAGLRIAQGDCVTFVDSDDWIESCYISKLVESMQEGGMAVCGLCREKEVRNGEALNAGESNRLNETSLEMNKTEAQKAVLCLDGIGGYVCGKLYDMRLIRKHRLSFREDIPIMEDHLFTMQYLSKIYNTVKWNKKHLYHYRDNSESATKTFVSRGSKIKINRILSPCTVLQLERKYIEPTPELTKCLYAVEVFHKKYALIRLQIHGKLTCTEYKNYLHDVRNGFMNYWTYDIGESRRNRLSTIICCISPRIYHSAWKFYGYLKGEHRD